MFLRLVARNNKLFWNQDVIQIFAWALYVNYFSNLVYPYILFEIYIYNSWTVKKKFQDWLFKQSLNSFDEKRGKKFRKRGDRTKIPNGDTAGD